MASKKILKGIFCGIAALSFFVSINSAHAGFFDWLNLFKFWEHAPKTEDAPAAVLNATSSGSQNHFNVIYNHSSGTALNNFELAEISLGDRSKSRVVKNVPTSSTYNKEAHLFALTDGQNAVVYTGYENAEQIKDGRPSVYFKNLETGLERKVFYPDFDKVGVKYEKGFKVNNPTAVQLANGDILLAFTYLKTPLVKGENPSSIIRVLRSRNNGKTWILLSSIKNGVYKQPNLVELSDGSIGLALAKLVTRQVSMGRVVSTNKDYAIYFLKSSDGGKTWPLSKQVHIGPQGANNLKPAIVQGNAGKLILIFRSLDTVTKDSKTGSYKRDGNLNVASSRDGGETWTKSNIAIAGKHPNVISFPRIVKVNNNFVAVYQKKVEKSTLKRVYPSPSFFGLSEGDEEDEDPVFAAATPSSDGALVSMKTTAISKNNGITWTDEKLIEIKEYAPPSSSSSSVSSSSRSSSVSSASSSLISSSSSQVSSYSSSSQSSQSSSSRSSSSKSSSQSSVSSSSSFGSSSSSSSSSSSKSSSSSSSHSSSSVSSSSSSSSFSSSSEPSLFIYPDTGDAGIVSDNIKISGLPQTPGNVRLLFQAKDVRAGDVVSINLEETSNGGYKKVGEITVKEDYSSFGGPWKNGNKAGIFMLLINDQDWPDPARNTDEATQDVWYSRAERNVNLIIKRQPKEISAKTNFVSRLLAQLIAALQTKESDAKQMSIRWILAQPERIGMKANTVAISPNQNHWGGIYWFGNATTTISNAAGTPMWALEQDWIDGIALTLSWAMVQPNGPIAAEGYKNSPMGKSVSAVLAKAKEKDKKVNLYVRGTNVLALKDDAAKCNSGDDIDGAKYVFGPVWAYNAWKNKGNSFRTIEDEKNPKPDSCWLEVYNDKTMSDLSGLVVHNSADTALYDVILGVYGNKAESSNSVIGFISRPTFNPGPDPGQYGFYGLKNDDFKEYLSDHKLTAEGWMDWVLSVFPQYGESVLAALKNQGIYAMNTNTFLSHLWFKTNNSSINWGKYIGESVWYDHVYRSVMSRNKDIPRDSNIVFVNLAIEGSAYDTKQTEQVLKDGAYNSNVPVPMLRNMWNLRAASQDGGVNWTEASNSFFDSGIMSDNQFLKMRQGFYNAFNVGSRSFELWNAHALKVNKAINNGDLRFKDEVNWFNKVFALRNKLAYDSDIANFPGAMIKGSFKLPPVPGSSSSKSSSVSSSSSSKSSSSSSSSSSSFSSSSQSSSSQSSKNSSSSRPSSSSSSQITLQKSGRFAHIGSSTSRFLGEQIDKIAANYDIVNITKFHADWDSAKQQEDARMIKEKAEDLRREVKINVYYSSSLVFWLNKPDKFKSYYGKELKDFKTEWLLHTAGNKVVYLDDVAGSETAFADLSNAEYRQWVLDVIGGWKESAPYDGVLFDNSRPLGDYSDSDKESQNTINGWNVDWNSLIGAKKVTAYNVGLKKLLDDSGDKIGNVIYNGIGRRKFMELYAPKNKRNTDLLNNSDGTMNEGFCLWREDQDDGTGKDYTLWPRAEMLEDINFMIKYGSENKKVILQKVNHIGKANYTDQNNQVVGTIKENQVKRYCFGSFLLGHQPGYTFFKYGPDYKDRELNSDPKEVSLSLGNPAGKYEEVKPSLFAREFDKGIVYVNMSDAASTVFIPYPVTLMNDGVEGNRYDKEDKVSISPKDALFFLKQKPSISSSSIFSGNAVIGPNSTLTASGKVSSMYKSAIDYFKATIAGPNLPKDGNTDIIVGTLADRQGIDVSRVIETELKNKGAESYWLNISKGKTEIVGSSELGALHGLSTLERKTMANNGIIKPESITDSPQLKTRALHISVAVKSGDDNINDSGDDLDGDDSGKASPVTSDDVKNAISAARLYNYNTLILTVTNRVRLDKFVEFGINPFKQSIWSKNEFLDVVKYAQENGMEFVPEIKLLSKDNKLFNGKLLASLMYNYDSYNPDKDEVYTKYIFPIIDELRSSVPGLKAIHIGHDEIAGHGTRTAGELQKKKQSMLPPELFLKDVVKLNDYIKSKGLRTWMWGDMLVSEQEYPEMKKDNKEGSNGLHGQKYRYFNLMSKIPKDIIINDWHYKNPVSEFPTISAFAQKGYQVLGATWMNEKTIKDFTKYLADMPAPREGMIATVWAKGWKKIDEIISVSGEAYWNAAKKNDKLAFEFSLSRPADKTVSRGSFAINETNIKPQNENYKQVLLYASNLPKGAYITFLPTACTPNPECKSSFIIYTDAATPVGNYYVGINGNEGNSIKTTTFKLTVK